MSTDRPHAVLLLMFFLCTVVGVGVGLSGGIISIVIILVFIFLICILLNYKIGVWLSLLLMPFSNTHMIPRGMFGITGLNPFNMLLAITLLAFIIVFLSSHNKDRPTIPRFPALLWLLVVPMILSAVYGSQFVSDIPDFYRTKEIIKFESAGGYLSEVLLKPVIIVIVCMMMATAIRNSFSYLIYMIPIFLSSFILAIVVIVAVLISGVSLIKLASSSARGFLEFTGMHANELGLFFNTVFALGLYTLSGVRNISGRVSIFVLISIISCAIILTFSRGAMLAYAITVLYYMFSRRQIRTMFMGIIILTAVVAILPSSVTDSITERASSGTQSSGGDVSAGRFDSIWKPLLPTILDSPLYGHGLNSVFWSEPARTGAILPVGHPHSAYIQVLLDFGIGGFLIIAIFYKKVWQLFKELHKTHPDPVWRGFFEGGKACLVILLIQGVTDDKFIPTGSQTNLWLAIGTAIGWASKLGITQRTNS